MSNEMERYRFDTLGELREWLNSFNKINLDAVWPRYGGHIELTWFETEMGDGSSVYDVSIEMGEDA